MRSSDARFDDAATVLARKLAECPKGWDVVTLRFPVHIARVLEALEAQHLRKHRTRHPEERGDAR